LHVRERREYTGWGGTRSGPSEAERGDLSGGSLQDVGALVSVSRRQQFQAGSSWRHCE
jgi:hypothetical protein